MQISAFNDFVRRSTFGRSGDQRLKEMAESWTIIFSAFRVCESCCDPVSCMADRAYKKSNQGLWIYVQDNLDLLPIVGLVGSNNLSTAIIILGIGGILIFVSNPEYMQFIGLGSAGAGFIAVFLAAESYRLERLAIWRNPEKYEKGFQTIQGLYAIGSGGIFGRGFGNSMQKLGFVPEAQNDMIFRLYVRKWEQPELSFLIFLFAMLLWRLGVTAMHAKDLAGALICGGLWDIWLFRLS